MTNDTKNTTNNEVEDKLRKQNRFEEKPETAEARLREIEKVEPGDADEGTSAAKNW